MEQFGYTLEELMPVTAELAAAFTGHEHSSVTYENAQRLMEAVLYCINECEKNSSYALRSDHFDAKEAYQCGQKIVLEKAKELHKLYQVLITDFDDYGCDCLKDTIVHGIPVFLQRYDTKFAPQETLLTLDYPVLDDAGSSSGIDRVLEYVRCVSLEQQFLRPFDRAYVIGILRSYHEKYEILIENICVIVLQNLIGHMMLDKPIHGRGFDSEDFAHVEIILKDKSIEEIQIYLDRMLHILVERYYGSDTTLYHYLCRAILDMAVRIKCSLQNHSLDKIFLI